MEIQEHMHKSTPLESVLTGACKVLTEDEEKQIEDCLKEFEILKEIPPSEEIVEILKEEPKDNDVKLELKLLPAHLKYMFLEENKPVI